MTVSCVIPHWNQRELLESLLDSLLRLRLPAGWTLEAVVVDNASEDGSPEAAEAHGAKVLRLDRNYGVSHALNRGIEASSGQLVALLNNDVELAPDWLEKLAAALEAPEVWFAAGKTMSWSERERIDGAGDALCRGGAAWRLGNGRLDGPLFAQPRRTYFPSATAALFKREFFSRVGLFEESFFAYLEDVDLGLRAAVADLPGVYAPEAVAWHHGSGTTGAWSGAMVRWITSHQLLLLAKHYPLGLLLRFAWPIATAQLLWAALAISRGRALDWAAGAWDGVRRGGALRTGGAAGRSARLAAVLTETEREILTIQRATGWDAYWRWYDRLAGGRA
ncbi:MAG: glycosyltransferase [Acidobacteria bacterium]|nr:glycosyltransferase [Acidobacteriota bacterium]